MKSVNVPRPCVLPRLLLLRSDARPGDDRRLRGVWAIICRARHVLAEMPLWPGGGWAHDGSWART